jgi:hypothetical protein
MDLDRYTDEEYLDCVSNKDYVLGVVSNPKTRYKGPGGYKMAAIVIQTRWRGYRCYSNFR